MKRSGADRHSQTDPDPIVFGHSRIASRRRTPDSRRRRKRRLLVLLAAVLVILPPLTAIWAFWIEPGLLTVTRYTVWLERLPENWDGRTLAFLTDTHLGASYKPERLARVADLIDAEKPDLILFGGDLIDSRTPHDPDFVAEAAGVLARMKAPYGQFAVAGNHDNRLNSEYRFMSELLENGGFILLDNASVLVDGLWLGGLAESYFGRPDHEKAFSAEGLMASQAIPGDPAKLFRLLLMHQPDYAAALPEDSADLIFSGHSHNGQITFFGHPVLTVYEGSRYPYGLYTLDNTTLIVSRGLGTVGIPARLGAPPELVLVTVRSH